MCVGGVPKWHSPCVSVRSCPSPHGSLHSVIVYSIRSLVFFFFVVLPLLLLLSSGAVAVVLRLKYDFLFGGEFGYTHRWARVSQSARVDI